MWIVELHKPEGIIVVDIDSKTDAELKALGITDPTEFRSHRPVDLKAEVDVLKARVEKLEKS